MLQPHRVLTQAGSMKICAVDHLLNKKIIVVSGKITNQKSSPPEIFTEFINSKTKRPIKRHSISNGFTNSNNRIHHVSIPNSNKLVLIVGFRVFLCDLLRAFNIVHNLTLSKGAVECVIASKTSLICGGFFKGLFHLHLSEKGWKTTHPAKDYSNATSIVALETRNAVLVTFEDADFQTEVVYFDADTLSVITTIRIKHYIKFLHTFSGTEKVMFTFKDQARLGSLRPDIEGLGLLAFEGNVIEPLNFRSLISTSDAKLGDFRVFECAEGEHLLLIYANSSKVLCFSKKTGLLVQIYDMDKAAQRVLRLSRLLPVVKSYKAQIPFLCLTKNAAIVKPLKGAVLNVDTIETLDFHELFLTNTTPKSKA